MCSLTIVLGHLIEIHNNKKKKTAVAVIILE
jgi:hypothetical protein